MRIVQKFGGTSVADIARLEKVALTVKEAIDAGHQVAVVVSAMAGVTNTLVGYVRALTSNVHQPEYDSIVASGEQVTAGLLALALQQIGVPARSFLGWQLPIHTSSDYADATIQSIETKAIEACFSENITPIIAGFQGVDGHGRITTLGRGGSDTTAVALAAALKADWCDIYTDVEGVFTADPRVVDSAQKLETITYDEMVELAAQGAKVLQTKSVETAIDHGVRVRVLSSFTKSPGTQVVFERDYETNVSSITHTQNCSRIHFKTASHPKIALSALQQALAQHQISTDLFLQTVLSDDETHMTFVIQNGDVPKTIQALGDLEDRFLLSDLKIDTNIAKISVIGLDLRARGSGVGQKLLSSLSHHGIVAEMVACSDLKFSVVVDAHEAVPAVQALHQTFFQGDIS